MNLHLGLTPIISLLAGILILVVPRMLNYIVAIYLIVIGLIGSWAPVKCTSDKPVLGTMSPGQQRIGSPRQRAPDRWSLLPGDRR